MKLLSSIMLILNPISGFFMLACLLGGYWYLIPLLILGVVLNMKFYFYTHKAECEAYDKWLIEFKKTHTYIGLTSDYYVIEQAWENNITKEIVYL